MRDICLNEYLDLCLGYKVVANGNYSIGRTHYVGAQLRDINFEHSAAPLEDVIVLMPAYRRDMVTYNSAGPTPPSKPLKNWRNAFLVSGYGNLWYAAGWGPQSHNGMRYDILILRPVAQSTINDREMNGPNITYRTLYGPIAKLV